MKSTETKLGDIFKITSGGTPSRDKIEYYTGGNIPWVKTGDLKTKYLYYADEYINELGLKSSSAKLFPENTVLIALYGATIGACSILKIQAATNQACAAILPNKDVDVDYFYYYISFIKPQLISQGVGGAQPNISGNILKNTTIPLPPLDIQKKIATVLDKADQLRHKRKQAIAKLDQLIQSVFLDMFGDPVSNPKGFDITTIGDITSHVKDGPHISPNYVDDGIPILSTRNIRPGELIMDDVKFLSKEEYDNITKFFKPKLNDVLLTKGGTTGYAKVVDFAWPFCVWVHVAVLRPKENVEPLYLEYALNSKYCYTQSQKYTHGITNKDLGLTRIIKIKLLLPPFNIQKSFADKVQIFKFIKNKMKSELIKLDTLFSSLLHRSFRGELEFNDNTFQELEETEI